MIKLTILHSNDIHGDFVPVSKDGQLTGGISFLSGYVSSVRRTEENVVYAIAGDLFQGSVVDKAYKGLSTIKLFNVLEPDVFEVGNHEIDYGLSHLLFLEKCADFPILCANLYVRSLNRRLFLPYLDIERGGLKIRFIGLLTESVSEKISQEELIESEISVRSVPKELEKVFAATDWDRADMTILLTHIGIEEDKKLAALIQPEWGVDLIIGAHSHTRMEAPLPVNGIPIVQAGLGSSQIGRLDLIFDEELHIQSSEWSLIPINEDTCDSDPLVDFYLERLTAQTNIRYDGTLTTLKEEYTHPGFHRETQLIDLFADIYADAFGADVFVLSTNIIRCKKLGPKVTRKDLELYYPYDNAVYSVKLPGSTLTRVIRHIYRKESWFGAMIFFLFSGALSVDFDKEAYEIRDMRFRGGPIDPDKLYILGFTEYAYKNMEAFLGLNEAETKPKVSRLAINDREILEEYLMHHEGLELHNESRLNYVG